MEELWEGGGVDGEVVDCFVARLLGADGWSGGVVVVVVWDEGGLREHGEGCARVWEGVGDSLIFGGGTLLVCFV